MTGKTEKSPGLFFSALYGGCVYEWTGKSVRDPLARGDGRTSPLVKCIHTKSLFYLKRIAAGKKERKRYSRYILSPPQRQVIAWPADLVALSPEQRRLCGLSLARDYKDAPPPDENGEQQMALLFPYQKYPGWINGLQALPQHPDAINWDNPAVRRMAVKIVRALALLNQTGYYYADFRLSRFFISENASAAFLDFSPLLYPIGGSHLQKEDRPSRAEYPLEFGDPAVAQGILKKPDRRSQDYSLCAMLFYLFTGRHAYDGRLLSGYVDYDAGSHYIKFRDSQRMPIFIFDPADPRNHLGALSEDRQTTALWERLPVQMRERFLAALKQENAERLFPTKLPNPQDWLAQFEQFRCLKH